MNNYKELLSKIGNRPILLIGDTMLDQFIYGDVNRISPEGPIPILNIASEKQMLGGAGNVWANIQAMGGQAILFSVIGKDIAGKAIYDKMAAITSQQNCLIEDPYRPTIIKTRYIAQNQQLLRVDHEKTQEISPAIEEALLQAVKSHIRTASIIVLSDYGKGVLTKSVVETVIKEARQAGIPVLVDPKSRDFSKYQGATIITPNRKELSEACGNIPVETNQQIENAARGLIKAHDFEIILATRSEQGMSIINDHEASHIPTQAREVYDVSGAGDTVVAMLASSLAAGGSPYEAAILSNIAAGLAVAKLGTAVITRNEILDSIELEEPNSFIAPILTWDAALNLRQKWVEQGLKVGLTNGCFDILHYGHVQYLATARQQCDKLIIALNHDQSVRLLKGPERPINNQEGRAAVIAALASCDMVVFFGAEKTGEDNTPCDLIAKIQPDIYFKGGDYTLEHLPETKIVQAYGGKVEIMALYEGHSTTAIIEKIR